ncbi:MAG: diguanylate cyclase [Elusimicrobiota bacterium]
MEKVENKTIEELEAEGYRIIDVIAGDTPLTTELKYIIDKIVQEKRGTFYSDILCTLASERFSEQEAKSLWEGILQHKYIVSEKLRRNVGIRVAALDYLENIKKIITMPKIIDEGEFRETLKFAERDALTDVFNRRAVLRELVDEIEYSGKNKEVFSLIMLDLDGYKNFNDTHGHQAGDIVLQEFAGLLKTISRKEDVIGRYGGDEFVIVLSDVNKISARVIAEKIRATVEREFKASIGITVSLGIAEYPSDGKTQDDLISQSDEAMYRAKEFGGNKVIYFKPVEIVYAPHDKTVKKVSCAGDFNRWNKNLGIMKYVEDRQEWRLTLNLKPGVYKYKFIVDGTKWIADPAQVNCSDDGFGGRCSILSVGID